MEDGLEETLETDPETSETDVLEVSEHAKMQWLLTQMATKADLDVWIARNDHSALSPDGKALVEYSMPSFPDLPLPSGAAARAKLIDVLWVDGDLIRAAFEVEYTTNVYSGLLRLSDLAFSMGSSIVRLCIVAPEARLQKVRSEMTRPTFRAAFDPKKERKCFFLSFEKLSEYAQGILALPEGLHLQVPTLESIAVDLLEEEA